MLFALGAVFVHPFDDRQVITLLEYVTLLKL